MSNYAVPDDQLCSHAAVSYNHHGIQIWGKSTEETACEDGQNTCACTIVGDATKPILSIKKTALINNINDFVNAPLSSDVNTYVTYTTTITNIGETFTINDDTILTVSDFNDISFHDYLLINTDFENSTTPEGVIQNPNQAIVYLKLKNGTVFEKGTSKTISYINVINTSDINDNKSLEKFCGYASAWISNTSDSEPSWAFANNTCKSDSSENTCGCTTIKRTDTLSKEIQNTIGLCVEKEGALQCAIQAPGDRHCEDKTGGDATTCLQNWAKSNDYTTCETTSDDCQKIGYVDKINPLASILYAKDDQCKNSSVTTPIEVITKSTKNTFANNENAYFVVKLKLKTEDLDIITDEPITVHVYEYC